MTPPIYVSLQSYVPYWSSFQSFHKDVSLIAQLKEGDKVKSFNLFGGSLEQSLASSQIWVLLACHRMLFDRRKFSLESLKLPWGSTLSILNIFKTYARKHQCGCLLPVNSLFQKSIAIFLPWCHCCWRDAGFHYESAPQEGKNWEKLTQKCKPFVATDAV